MADLYKSSAWMRMQIYSLKKSPAEIAKICNVNQATIYRWIERHGIKI